MQRDADFRIRIPRVILSRIEKYLDKDPRCLSKNTWMLIIINDALDNADKIKIRSKNGTL